MHLSALSRVILLVLSHMDKLGNFSVGRPMVKHEATALRY